MNNSNFEIMWAIRRADGPLQLNSIRICKKDCIAEWVKDSGANWVYWKRNYNFQCVKVRVTIEEVQS